MTEINPVGGGFQYHLVHPHDLAFAKGNDFEIFIFAAGFADYTPEGDGRPGRRVLLVCVVPLENLADVVMA